jgi:hydrogenase nickel incorporation protein HypA/HybF
MHELSIAQAVLEIVETHARGRRVTRVELKVGRLRQVVPDALAFAWELVCDAELVIEDVPGAGRCRDCGADTALPAFPLTCEHCRSWDVEVLRGEELLVDSLELEEREMVHGH